MASDTGQFGLAVRPVAEPAIVAAVEMRSGHGGMDLRLFGQFLITAVALYTAVLLNTLFRQGRPMACSAGNPLYRVPVVQILRGPGRTEVGFQPPRQIRRYLELAKAPGPDQSELF